MMKESFEQQSWTEYLLFLPSDDSFHTKGTLYQQLIKYLEILKVQISPDQWHDIDDCIAVILPEGLTEEIFTQRLQTDIITQPYFSALQGIRNMSIEKRNFINEQKEKLLNAMKDRVENEQYQDYDSVKIELLKRDMQNFLDQL